MLMSDDLFPDDEERTRLDELKEQCTAYHLANPEVWDLFVKLSFQKIHQHFQHYGAQAVIERIRFDSALGEDGKTQFKYNNDYAALYARRFHKMYPEHDGFFRTREQKSADMPAINRPPLGPGDYA